MSSAKIRVGVVGCGKISPAYVDNLKKHFAHLVDVVGCADVDMERARTRATELGIPEVCTVSELCTSPGVDLVVDLTNPGAHHPVSTQALSAGKHVFVEKPMATTLDLCHEMVSLAEQKGVTLAGAVDTFLGAGLVTCRRLIDEDAIGTPGTAHALIGLPARTPQYLSLYGGPLYDMAPYYVTALVTLLGPVRRVTGFVRLGPERPDTASAIAFPFETPVTAAATLELDTGLLATLHATGETSGYFPRVEIYGLGATLRLPDANGYGGPVTIRDKDGEREIPLDPGFAERGRALGVAEQALAIRTGSRPRTHSGLLYHVCEVLHAVHESSRERRAVDIASTCERPAPFDYASLAP